MPDKPEVSPEESDYNVGTLEGDSEWDEHHYDQGNPEDWNDEMIIEDDSSSTTTPSNNPSVTPSKSDDNKDTEKNKDDKKKSEDSKNDSNKNKVMEVKAGEMIRVAPMPPNPYFAFIMFAVGDNDFAKLPPEHIQNMTYTRLVESGGNTLEITLFDETAIKVEFLIAQAFDVAKRKSAEENLKKKADGEELVKANEEVDKMKNPDGSDMTEEAKKRKKANNTNAATDALSKLEKLKKGDLEGAAGSIKREGANPAPKGSGQALPTVRFQYGYVNGEVSPIYSMTLKKIDIDFSALGAVLRLECISSGAVKAKMNPKTCAYEGKIISDIVKEICKEEGWEEGIIVPTKPIADEGQENKTFYRKNQPATVFITSELCPKAIAADTGDGDYQFTLDDTSKKVNFRPKMHAPSIAAASTMHSYEFAWGDGNPSSRVIEFNPEYIMTHIMDGGGQIEAATFDAVKNQMFTTGYDKKTNESRSTIGGDKSLVDQSTTKTKIGLSSCSPDDMDSIAAMMWLSKAQDSIKATLTILGDPLINAMDIVSMVVLNKDGYAHHTSGAYLITKVVDTISGGQFTTQMELLRSSMKIGLDESGGIQIEMTVDLNQLGNKNGNQNGNQSLSGDGNSDIVKVAMDEVGTKEATGNNDTKYGEWFGMNNVAWCAIFVSWCANKAGISTDIIPKSAGVETYYTFFHNKNTWYDAKAYGGSYTPVQGDIVVFHKNYSTGDHVGIVAGVKDGKIITVEGNTGSPGEVKQKEYDPGNSWLYGYGHPAYPTTGQSIQVDPSKSSGGSSDEQTD